MCKVSIVDDHALFRRGVADIIRQEQGYAVLAEYASGADFLQDLPEQYPDVVLLDLQMPNESGLEILKHIRQTDQELKVIILTACEDEQVVIDAIQLGANGFLPKDTLPEVILQKLQDVLDGQIILHGQGVSILARQVRHTQSQLSEAESWQIDQQEQQDLADMTVRERETLLLIAKGLNNKLIARELGISDGTVKVYVKSLLRKLNVHSRLELSVWAHQHLKSLRN
ncbi:response regulator [Acinetobacter sp. ANC 4641]|uniref:response regulator n=1 Tax=Acinetobacter sp. ANC 4641 TaxID=2529847 RepID=UPI00103C15E0|nr:response regulator transcription factor [Acinetobacter sp. ANC 4641]TCB12319.1 response regulator transcription factor [Acinetobacter sp. ANC 4641]